MTCESTQPILNTTVQYDTFVLEFIQQEFVQSFAETIARNDPRWSELQKVTNYTHKSTV